MSVGMQVTQGRSAFLDLAIDAAKLDEGIKAAIRKLTRESKAELLQALRKPGTGRFYKGSTSQRRNARRWFGKTRGSPAYRASAPGQPPARMSGNLVNSVRTKYPRREKGYGAKVFAIQGVAFYRHFLEFGAGPAQEGKRKGAGGYRAPRPVFSPIQKKLDAQLEAAVLGAINDFAGSR